MTMTSDIPAPIDEFNPNLASIEAERAVLGAMLHVGDCIADVVELVRAEDFFRPTHQTIFGVMTDLYGAGSAVDHLIVFETLKKMGELQRVGGGVALFEMMHGMPSAANVAYYARIVAEKAENRRLAAYGAAVYARASSPGLDSASELVDWAADELSKVPARGGSEELRPVGELLPGTMDRMEAIGSRSGTLSGVPTGFIDLDALTQGLQPGQMWVVAARPAIGKSTLGLDFGRSCAIKHGLTAAVFSLEMSNEEIMMRLLSAEARVALHAIRSGTMSDDDWAKISRRLGEIGEAPLFIDDSANMSMMQIRAKCRKLKERFGLSVVIIDYLQLMSSPKKTESRQNEVSEISRAIKLLAKELEITVIAISQLNRGPEQRQDKRPLISDLRESGSIEQDADGVILLFREDAYEKESPRAGEAELIVAKHRNGPTSTITVAFQGHYSRFVDMAPA